MKVLRQRTENSYQMIIKKITFTFFIVVIYLLGRKVLLPGVMSPVGNNEVKGLERMVLTFSGVDVSNVSIFSLGLSPYMTTAIVWRLISMNERWGLKNWSLEKTDRTQKIIMLLFCVAQAIGIAYSFDSKLLSEQRNVSTVFVQGVLVITIVGGTFLLFWLADLNSEYGVGGMTIVVICTILIAFQKNMLSFILENANKSYAIVLFKMTFVVVLFLVFIQLLVEKSEIRLRLNRILSSDKFYDKSYLPIKIAPASSMPLMYASSILVLVNLVLKWIKSYTNWDFLGDVFNFTQPVNLIIYLIIIYLLSLLFAYINLEPQETAKRLQRQGEYFDYIQPGKITLNYLNYFISRQAHIGAMYLVFLVALPYVVNYIFPLPNFLLTLPVTVIILTGMLLSLGDEFNVLKIGMFYDSDFRKESVY